MSRRQAAGLIRRILADAIAFLTLAILVALLARTLRGIDLGTERWYFVLVIYVILAISGYASWRRDSESSRRRWGREVLGSIGLGLLLLIPDVLVGHFQDPSQPLVKAAADTGIMFAFTLYACPGYTLIALAGWARGLVLHRSVSPNFRWSGP